MKLAMQSTAALIPNQTRAEYEQDDAINFSRLKHIARSPRHYRHHLEVPRPDTAAVALGRAVHLAVLEPERFASECMTWTGGRRFGKEWDAFCAANAGREILTADETELCRNIAAAVLSDPIASTYVTGGRSEQSVRWTHDEPGCDDGPAFRTVCKGRLDYVRADCLADLKTCRDASPAAFGRESWRLHYHTQAAWYRDGYAAAAGRVLPFAVVAVEKEPPHIVQVYRLSDLLLDMGRDEYREWLRTLDRCRRENVWPGYSDGEFDLSPPQWALPDDDIADLDLVIGG